MEWGELIAHVCYCTGWTWDYVADNVDIPRLTYLRDYWSQFPPLPIAVAHYIGAAKPKAKLTSSSQEKQAEELLGMFPLQKG
jgi:hypothetical protein